MRIHFFSKIYFSTTQYYTHLDTLMLAPLLHNHGQNNVVAKKFLEILVSYSIIYLISLLIMTCLNLRDVFVKACLKYKFNCMKKLLQFLCVFRVHYGSKQKKIKWFFKTSCRVGHWLRDQRFLVPHHIYDSWQKERLFVIFWSFICVALLECWVFVIESLVCHLDVTFSKKSTQSGHEKTFSNPQEWDTIEYLQVFDLTEVK